MIEDLDLVEEEDQFTHLLTLEDAVNGEDILSMSGLSSGKGGGVNGAKRGGVRYGSLIV